MFVYDYREEYRRFHSIWKNDSMKEYFETEALRIKKLDTEDYIDQIEQLGTILIKMYQLQEIETNRVYEEAMLMLTQLGMEEVGLENEQMLLKSWFESYTDLTSEEIECQLGADNFWFSLNHGGNSKFTIGNDGVKQYEQQIESAVYVYWENEEKKLYKLNQKPQLKYLEDIKMNGSCYVFDTNFQWTLVLNDWGERIWYNI